MTTRRRGLLISLIVAISILTACGPMPVATSTPGASPTPRPPRADTDRRTARFYPASKPSAARGAAIYADACAACHGATGKGDGIAGRPMRPRPTDFTDLSTMRQQRPDWFYQATTKGVLGSAMLAFDGALDEQERWDVVFYVWSLATSPERIEAGEGLYARHCASCHGSSGDRQGVSAGTPDTAPADLSDPRTMFARTSADLFAAISDGLPTQPGHAWPELSADERWAIIDYVWTFMYDVQGAD